MNYQPSKKVIDELCDKKNLLKFIDSYVGIEDGNPIIKTSFLFGDIRQVNRTKFKRFIFNLN